MATGRRPFTAASRLSLLNRIVNDDPPRPGAIAPLPLELEAVILRCLRKDPSRRYQTGAEVKAALEGVSEPASGGQGRAASRFGSPVLRKAGWVALVVAAAAALVAAGGRIFPRSPEVALRTVKFTITPAMLVRSGAVGEIDAEVSISRDGKHIAYVESPAGQLWIRDLDQEQARPVPGATKVYQAFW